MKKLVSTLLILFSFIMQCNAMMPMSFMNPVSPFYIGEDDDADNDEPCEMKPCEHKNTKTGSCSICGEETTWCTDCYKVLKRVKKQKEQTKEE